MPDDDQEALCERSGNIESSDPLVSFLYDIMRDHLPVGTVEALIADALKAQDGASYDNGWLAQYAMDVAKRLRPRPVLQVVQRP